MTLGCWRRSFVLFGLVKQVVSGLRIGRLFTHRKGSFLFVKCLSSQLDISSHEITNWARAEILGIFTIYEMRYYSPSNHTLGTLKTGALLCYCPAVHSVSSGCPHKGLYKTYIIHVVGGRAEDDKQHGNYGWDTSLMLWLFLKVDSKPNHESLWPRKTDDVIYGWTNGKNQTKQ